MKFQNVLAACRTVQAVHILCDEREAVAAPALFHLGERVVAGIGLHRPELSAAHVVEAPDEGRIALEGERRGDFLNAIAFPQAAAAAKGGDAALRRDAGAGQHDDALGVAQPVGGVAQRGIELVGGIGHGIPQRER